MRTPDEQLTMDLARAAMVTQSRGENGKTRRPGVERYLPQFINGTSGKGAASARNFKRNYDRIKK
jgi:hypothetical protein